MGSTNDNVAFPASLNMISLKKNSISVKTYIKNDLLMVFYPLLGVKSDSVCRKKSDYSTIVILATLLLLVVI